MRLDRGCAALLLCLVLLSAQALAAMPGSPNPGFGKGGVVRINAGTVAAQRWPDLAIVGGKPVVLTESRDGRSALFFLRRNGRRDESVGDAGMVSIENGDWRRLAVQPDGRIVLAGSIRQIPAVMRIEADGGPDPTFSGDGIAEVPLETASSGRRASEDYFGQVLVRGDGTILALRNPLVCGEESCTASRGAVAAIRPDGTLDETFGTGGIAWLPALPTTGPPPESVYRVGTMALRRDGGILVGGTLEGRLAVYGFTAGGNLDPTWGGDGIVVSKLEYEEGEEGWGSIGTSYGEARSILVRNDNRVLVVADAAVLGLHTDGTVERAFGERGVVRTEAPGREEIEFGDAVLDASGRPVLGGEWEERSTVVRLTPKGAFNSRFSKDGIVALDLSRQPAPERVNEAITSVAVGSGIFTAGFAFRGRRFEPTLIRLR